MRLSASTILQTATTATVLLSAIFIPLAASANPLLTEGALRPCGFDCFADADCINVCPDTKCVLRPITLGGGTACTG
ncbi:hypothetical protein C8Q77DRAFT_1159624 [Trametes polyzona]|nr:hypothetical protein C8Q77DRAFT_1159624 [Trametes polyzona]